MTDWHEEIGKRLIDIDNRLKIIKVEQISNNETLRDIVRAVEDLTQEFYMLRGEIKKININFETLIEMEREIKTGVDIADSMTT